MIDDGSLPSGTHGFKQRTVSLRDSARRTAFSILASEHAKVYKGGSVRSMYANLGSFLFERVRATGIIVSKAEI